ncbi:MAG TPA: hypothetical protein ENI99_03410 [Sedimenticola sp.]|nr:hypothetical protein [Sedimenticola sp.]
MTVQFDNEDEMPRWDVALAALITEKHQNKGRPLHNDDFLRLAEKYAIRFDDIMDTVLRLVIHGKWVYRDVDGHARPVTREAFERMHKGGRLVRSDLKEYDGSWAPAD